MRSLAGYAFAVALWSLGEILYSPSAAAFMAKHSLPENVGADQGAYAFTWTLGLTVGAPLGQLLLTAAGSGVLWSCCPLLGLAVGAAHLVAVQRRAPSGWPDRPRAANAACRAAWPGREL